MKDRLGTCENDAEDHPQGLHEWRPFCINWHEQPAQGEGATCPTCASSDLLKEQEKKEESGTQQ